MLKTSKQLLRGDYQELDQKECWTQIETKNTSSEADLAVVTPSPTNWRLEGEGWMIASSSGKKRQHGAGEGRPRLGYLASSYSTSFLMKRLHGPQESEEALPAEEAEGHLP